MRTCKQYRALLERAHGYTAYACRMLPARRTPSTSQRSRILAQAISARYAAIERRWPLMAFIFEQPDRSSVSVSHNYHTTHLSIFMNPRMILRMLVSNHEGVRRVVADRTTEQPSVREAALMTLAASPIQKQGPQEHEEVIARIVRRAVREENPSRQAARTSVTVPQVAPPVNFSPVQSPSLERVYRHAGKANNDTSVIAVNAANEKEKPRVTGRDTSAASAVQSPIDLTRLTDQVMQALDRRIVAQRERMGRV